MPAIKVSIDGSEAITICTDQHTLIHADVHGSRISDEFAFLDLHASRETEGGKSVFLIWLSALPLKPGQVVRVSFLESGKNSHTGKTLEELCSPEYLVKAKMIYREVVEAPSSQLRAKPKLRDRYAFQVTSTSGASYSGDSQPSDDAFSFSFIWTSYEPKLARASLRSYSFGDLDDKSTSRDSVFKEKVNAETSVIFEPYTQLLGELIDQPLR